MDNDEGTKQLLRFLIRIMGRSVMPPEQVLSVVASKASSEKQIKAYNLCDGTLTQSKIVAKLHLDVGNFSRTVARWEAAGIVFSIGEGRERCPLHLYPLQDVAIGKKSPK